MARSKKPIIGDIYEVQLQGNKKGYVQYIGNDSTQLNSDVIRVFRRRYSVDAAPVVEDILEGEIEFYCHVTGMEFGEKDGSWKKIEHSDNVGDLKLPHFRSTRDAGNTSMKVSNEWDVWRMNEPSQFVGKLEGENTQAEIGSVLPPAWVVQRMNTGKYHFFYHDYK